MDEDEELWFNEDEDDDEAEAVDKSRMEDDYSDGYGKYMEAKKGKRTILASLDRNHRRSAVHVELTLPPSSSAGAAHGANNGKAAPLPPTSPPATPNNSSASSVKTVALPASPVVKVMNTHLKNDLSTVLGRGSECVFPQI